MKKALIIIFAALMAALVFSGCARGGKRAQEDLAVEPPAAEEEKEVNESAFVKSTLYFISDEGYIVPVTKLIPWEDGIAAASLRYMTSSPDNIEVAKRMGLVPAIPGGTEFSISIRDGNALVDLKNMPSLEDAKAELDMIRAIVNALTEFPTVTTVTITRGGSSDPLEHGTELPVRQTAYPLNIEESSLSASAGGALATLYFPNSSGALTVPVSRMISGAPSVYSVSAALIGGSGSRGLMNCFPENTLLLGAAIENGTATVNLSSDFKAVSGTEGMYSLAYRTLFLSLEKNFGITRLRIQVNGEDYSPEGTAAPSGVNEAR